MPVFLPGKSHGQRSLVGYSPWGRKESDTTEPPTHTHTHTPLTKSAVNSGELFQAMIRGRRDYRRRIRKTEHCWDLLVVPWLRLHAPNAGGPGSIPGRGTKPNRPQLNDTSLPTLELKEGGCEPTRVALRSRTRQGNRRSPRAS